VGGTWTGQLTVRTGTPAVGAFRIGVERVSLDRLVTLLGGPPRRLKGAVDAAVAGRIGPEWDGRALLRLTNGTLAGVPVSTAPAPLDWAIEPTSGRTRARIRVPSARVAGGRVRGEAELRWAGRLGLEAEVDFDSLAVQPLARALPLVNDHLQGELKGRCQIKGARVRSVDDLSGSFEATLARSQALTLPVLRALTSSLGVGSPSSTMFSQTAAQGRFGKGVIHLDRMTMVAENVQMFITGRLSRQGNLDLNVTADVPQITVVGIAAGLLRPLDLLRRRLLFFHVHGSIRSPIVQPRTAEFLQQEIILFFMPFVVTP
jgi:hypothetical protein